ETNQLAAVYDWLGRAYEQEEQYEAALEAYQQALQLLDAEQEPQVYGIVLDDIGDVYRAQGQLKQALNYYQRAAEAKERGDDSSGLAATLQTMAEVQLELGQEQEALQLYQKCLALLQGLVALDEPDKSEPHILMDTARCQEALNNWAEATETYELLESILLKKLKQRSDPIVIRRLAWTKYKLGMFEEAAELSNQVDAPETNI